jgi:uncharacterized repeat protein (TIGR01451 family)
LIGFVVRTIFEKWLFVVLSVATPLLSAQFAPQSCATPGLDGINYSAPSYFPGAASAGAGVSSVTVGAIRTGAGAGAAPIAVGDLLMILQMQDGTYNTANSIAFGDNATGRGYTSLGNAGKFEFKRVTSSAGGVIGLDSALQYAYTRAAPTAAGANASGQRRFQVIRVPQFSNVTLPAGTNIVPDWNGETGGVWVIDATGNVTLNGAIIDASARGFRGAGGIQTLQVNGAIDYSAPLVSVTAGSPTRGAFKGEGIAGTPRYIRNAANTPFSFTDLNTSGYSPGTALNSLEMARGAPGNAGGGGTQHNAGGGGGSNVGRGGIGGNTFGQYSATNTGSCVNFGATFWACGGDGARAVGGLGGGTVTASIENIILGGGGGAGDNNNATDNPTVAQAAGGNGGGLIFLRANTVSGNATFSANGQDGLPGGRDAAGGGGAGGTVVVITNTANPGITANVRGGVGGKTGLPLRAGETQGPGGGGGGGAVIVRTGVTLAATNLAGGASGVVEPVAGVTNSYGSGSAGGATAVTGFIPAQREVGSDCLPRLVVSKSTTTPTRTEGLNTTASYVISISNTGTGSAAGVFVQDDLQAPFVYAPSPAATMTYSATPQALGPATSTVSGTDPFTVGTPGGTGTTTNFFIPPGGSVTVTVVVSIGSATQSTGPYQNSATVSYLDPTRSAATASVSPGGSYQAPGGAIANPVGGSNYASGSSTQEDVTIVRSANLGITKTDGITAAIAGSTLSYTITVASFGPSPVVNAVLTDPPAAGLACTTVSCAQFGAAVCPAGPLTIAALQAGIAIPSLPASANTSPPPDRVEFYVGCGVSATGL